MPRRPTEPELAQLQGYFPQLSPANVWITAEPTGVYNCISYSLGITNRWINPPQPLANFQALYNNPPYNHPTVPAGDPSAAIDGWATDQMTHGSRTSTSLSAPLWESKLGSWFRITHGRSELTGNTYGHVVTSFRWQAAMVEADHGEAEPLQPSEIERVHELAGAVPAPLRERFAGALADWKRTWSELPLAASSDTRDYAQGPAFERLLELGPDAVPLVLEQIVEADDGFLLLALLERWWEREDLVAVAVEQPLESQQSRAIRALRSGL